MPGSALTLEKKTEAIVLREAGYTIADIAYRVDCSVSTLQRLFRRTFTKKGTVTAEAVKEARESLLQSLSNTDQLKEELARSISDDIAHSRLMRERAALALEELKPTNTAEAALTMRALTAYSTIIKNTSDTMKHNLAMTAVGEADIDVLPELIIRELTGQELAEIVRTQASNNDDGLHVERHEDNG